MTSGWYYAKAGATAGDEVGPLSWDELYLLAQTGTLDPRDIVWNPRLPRGMAAGMIPELFPGMQIPRTPAPVEPLQPPILDVEETFEEDDTLEPDEEHAETRSISDRGRRPESQSKRLPVFVLLLVVAIAAAGLTAYFLYFRDVGDTAPDQIGMSPTSSIVSCI